MIISHRADVHAEPGESLTVAHLAELVEVAPADARVVAITVDRGSQRDPDEVLVGLTATWETEA